MYHVQGINKSDDDCWPDKFDFIIALNIFFSDSSA